MGKGKEKIFILADCAAVALIIRPNAAVSSMFIRFIRGKQAVRQSATPRVRLATHQALCWRKFPNSPRRTRLKRGNCVTQHTFNI